jgi:hypothetical protein
MSGAWAPESGSSSSHALGDVRAHTPLMENWELFDSAVAARPAYDDAVLA